MASPMVKVQGKIQTISEEAMDTQIVLFFVLIDDFLKAYRHHEDANAR